MSLSPDIRVGIVLDRIKKINNSQQWLVVDTMERTAPILPEVKPLFTRLNDALEPFVGEDRSLNKAWIAADRLAIKLARRYGLMNEWNHAFEAAGDSAADSLRQAAAFAVSGNRERSSETTEAFNKIILQTLTGVGRAAAWEIVADLPELEGNHNPNGVLLDFYALGLTGVSVVRLQETEQLIAHAPVKLAKKSVARAFACIMEFDDSLRFRHGLIEACTQRVAV